jgi:hypothetical protein
LEVVEQRYSRAGGNSLAPTFDLYHGQKAYLPAPPLVNNSVINDLIKESGNAPTRIIYSIIEYFYSVVE